ncbi:hypothetical protein [Streptomyces sp. AM8-1-1]|uniref:hypothetical protein n=1 Tax=Streptomyces sp. AM8-1-1 TaxID=3075825 RepID=UPI0028C49729|nr:hypothetical protein [Streptomyces sp. AM8-1-1]WNO73274.1 hypothetical protein RPQ07_17275 [Streptomyces sp. AM8-1-1]
MTDWSQLSHAYGPADDIPRLLDDAESDPAGPAWDSLWSCLCHQGTVYSASFAALPRLAAMAQRFSATDRQAPLVLAGAIVAGVDRPHGCDDPHISHAADIATLIRLTEEILRHPEVDAAPDTYVCLLETLLSLEGAEVWGGQLDGLNSEEYEVPCPRCEAENFIVFGEYGHFSTLDEMYMREPSAGNKPLMPAEPGAMEGLAARLHARAVGDGQIEVARKLTYVFGSASCADCGAVFRVDQAVVARWGA